VGVTLKEIRMFIYDRILAGEFDNPDDWENTALEIRKALAKENDMENHPKEPQLFEIAWDLGHGDDLTEVIFVYERIAELLE